MRQARGSRKRAFDGPLPRDRTTRRSGAGQARIAATGPSHVDCARPEARVLSPALTACLLLGPLVVWLAASYLGPLLGILWISVSAKTGAFAAYETALSDPLILQVFWRSLRICLLVTLVSTAAAYVVTFLWVRGSPLVSMLVELCIMIPFWISILTRSFGWLALLSYRGIVNTVLIDLGIISTPLALVRNEFGVVLGMVHILLPFAVFPIATAMRSIDDRVMMAAEGMGASRLRIFWQIFVPMTGSGIVGAALLVFVFSIGFYVTPSLLGGGHSIMIAELIYLRIFQIPDWPLAAAISAILMLCVSGLMVVMMKRFPGFSR